MKFKPCCWNYRSVCNKELLHTETFTNRSFYTESLLQRESFTLRSLAQRNFCTQGRFNRCFSARKLLHTHIFDTQKRLHRTRSFYAQKLSQTDAFAQFYTLMLLHREAPHRCFFTQTPLHKEAFTQRRIYTESPLHKATFTRKSF